MADEPTYVQPDLSIFGEEHVRVYRETDGEQGYLWNGAPILLLTTTGRKSGEPRTSALIFGRDGDDLLVVASKGGAPDDPLWYSNLEANRDVEVQVKGDVFAATAHDATGDEKARLWSIMTELWPNYDAYQARTDPRDPARSPHSQIVKRARTADLDEQIVEAAQRLLYESGDGFTIQQLVEEAGVALQTFYRQFPSKDQLLIAVLDRSVREFCAEMAAATASFDDPLARMRSYVTRPLRLLESGRSEESKHITREHFRLQQIDPDAVARTAGAFTALVLDALVEAQRRGLIVSLDPERDAWMITELVMTTFHHYAFAGLGPDADSVIDHLWGFCLSAVGGRQ